MSEGLHIVGIVTERFVEWVIGFEQALAFQVLGGGKSTLSLSQAGSISLASSICAWVCKLIVNWSDESSTTDTGNILSLMHVNVTSVTASVVPVEAVLWWEVDMGGPSGANWQASCELASSMNGSA